METVRIAALLGDGIGPDIVPATMMVLQEAGRKHDLPVNFDVLPSGLAALQTHVLLSFEVIWDKIQKARHPQGTAGYRGTALIHRCFAAAASLSAGLTPLLQPW